MEYPISEQLERGSAIFKTALTEVPIVLPKKRLVTQPLPMEESWGPLGHVSLEAKFGLDCHSDTGVFDLFPEVNVLFYLDPDVDLEGTFKVAAHYRPLKHKKPNVLSDEYKLKPEKLFLKPSYVGFDIEDSGHDRIQPHTGQENEEHGPLVAELLQRGIDVFQGLGSTGLVERLTPWYPFAPDEYKSVEDYMAR